MRTLLACLNEYRKTALLTLGGSTFVFAVARIYIEAQGIGFALFR